MKKVAELSWVKFIGVPLVKSNYHLTPKMKTFAKNRAMVLVLIVCICRLSMLHADIGSDSAVSRQSQIVFTGASNNTVLGFAALAGGFFLTDTATSFSFSSYFPVGVSTIFNGGTCYLARDMSLDSYVTVDTSGTIEGNFHTLKFAPRSDLLMFPGVGQFKRLDQKSTADIAYAIDWFVTDTYLLVGTSAQLQVYVWNDTTTSLTYTTGIALSGQANEVRWQPTFTNLPYYCALATVSGLYTYSFDPSVARLTQVASVITSPTSVSSVDWASSGTYLAMSLQVFGFGSASIRVYSVSNGLMTLVTSTNSLPPTRNVFYSALAWNKSGNYLAVGTLMDTVSTPPNNTLFLYAYNGLSLVLTQSIRLAPTSSTLYGSAIYTLEWSHDGELLAVGLGGASSETTTNKIRIFKFDATAAPNCLTEVTSYRNGETYDVYNISWNSDDSKLVYTRNSPNSQLRVCSVDRVTQELNLWAQGALGALGWSVSWNNIQSIAELERIYIAVAPYNSTVSVWGVASQPFIFKDIDIVFDGPVQLTEPIIFNGQCSVTTNGNVLDANNKSIILGPGAGVTVYNTTLYGMGGSNNVVFLDNTSTITLISSLIINTNDFYLQGPLTIEGDVIISGSYKFTYSTDSVSYIKDYSTLYFDSGVTFSYDPPGGANNLLNFSSMSSELYLNEVATYISGVNGLILTKGQLTISGQCPLVAPHGLYLGDGTMANNVTLNALSDSGIKINGGYLINSLLY